MLFHNTNLNFMTASNFYNRSIQMLFKNRCKKINNEGQSNKTSGGYATVNNSGYISSHTFI